MDPHNLVEHSRPFLRYLTAWAAAWPTPALATLTAAPERVAVMSVDMLNGFCHAGPLASPRVKNIIPPVVQLLTRAHAAGVRHFILTQDAHPPDAVEFGQFPPHCVRGSVEADTVPEIKTLPFYPDMVIVPKNSTSSGLHTGLEAWLEQHPAVDTFLIVGNCTDLCIYQLAMYLRLRANALQLTQRIILPAECVDTYDLPVEAAQPTGILPHPGDLLHLIFLYSLQLNGVEVVKTIA